jgi:hypothetical protein
MKAAIPCSAHAAITAAWSVATITFVAEDRAARSATRTTIGLPQISAKGLFGKRVDAMRAGIITIKDMAQAMRGKN